LIIRSGFDRKDGYGRNRYDQENDYYPHSPEHDQHIIP
jgi:hypothetical protein